MKRIINILMIFIFLFTISIINNKLDECVDKSKNSKHLLLANYGKDYSKSNLIDEFDYAFKGEVISYIETSQYNGNGCDIPYTYFNVNVIDIAKGKLDNKIIIKFYGGYDNFGNLVLLENMEYPQIGMIYDFYCNRSVLKFEIDGRTIENSFPILNQYSMKKKILNTTSNDTILQKDNSNISILAASPIISVISPIEGGGTGYTNFSFETAYNLTLDTCIGIYLAPGDERYYKISRKTLDYISIYSTGNYDTKIYLYDSNYNLIGYNDDVELEREKAFTSNNNFFINFYADKDQTYYMKIKLFDSNDTGSFPLYVVKDNWTESTISNLISSWNGVYENEVNIYVDSQYISEIDYGINEWGKLGSVIIHKQTQLENNLIKVYDFFDPETGSFIAATVYYPNDNSVVVKYNKHYFETMTNDQRIHTILHEFGHVLGIKEFTNLESKENVMHQGILNLTKLGPADIAVYREKWN